MLLLVGIAFAQENTYDNTRRTVLFSEVSGPNAVGVKYYMLRAFAETKRLNIFDSRSYNQLPQSLRDNVKLDAVFTAVVDSMPTRKMKDILTGEMKWFSYSYVTLQVRNPKTNAIVTTTNLRGSGSDSKDADKAIESAMLTLSNDVTSFIDGYYIVRGNILSVDESKKQKAQLVTINVGSSSSIYEKMKFNVLNANGDQLGRLQVKEILGSDRTICKVSGGGDTIQKAFEAGEELRIASRPLGFLSDLLIFDKKVSAIVNEPDPDCNKLHTVLYVGAVGNSSVAKYIDNMMMKELNETKRLYAISLDAYNNLSDAQRNSLTIDGIIMTISGDFKTETEKKEAYTSYSVEGQYVFILSDARTGKVHYAENNACLGISTESQEKAFERSVKGFNLDYAIDCGYPIYTSVLSVDQSKKNKAKVVSIGVGKNSSIYKGMLLTVYTKDGNGMWSEIGEVKVDEIGENSSSCDVKKGGEEIMKAFDENIPNRIVTRPKSFLGGLLKL